MELDVMEEGIKGAYTGTAARQLRNIIGHFQHFMTKRALDAWVSGTQSASMLIMQDQLEDVAYRGAAQRVRREGSLLMLKHARWAILMAYTRVSLIVWRKKVTCHPYPQM